MTNSLNVNYYSVCVGGSYFGPGVHPNMPEEASGGLLSVFSYSLKVTPKLLFLLGYVASEHQDSLVYNNPTPGLTENWSQLTNHSLKTITKYTLSSSKLWLFLDLQTSSGGAEGRVYHLALLT